MHSRTKNHEIVCLPPEGLVTVNGLAEFIRIRNDKLAKKLQERGIKTVDLGEQTKFKFVNLADPK